MGRRFKAFIKEVSLVRCGIAVSLLILFPFLVATLKDFNSLKLGVGILVVYWGMVLFYLFLDYFVFSNRTPGKVEELLLFAYYFVLGSAIYIAPLYSSKSSLLLGIAINSIVSYLWVLISIRLQYLVFSIKKEESMIEHHHKIKQHLK